mgnify:CR=1 FL=1
MAQGKKVIIIGAGPAGSIAAALVQQQGHQAIILEKETFPRFSIGESLLPQCMEFIEQAGMLPALQAAGFQLKTGAAFLYHGQYSEFCFSDQFSTGFTYTYQVQRARFDALLASEAQRQGVDIRWQQRVLAADFSAAKPVLTVIDEQSQETYRLEADFVLDASGFGRVLPRLLELETPSGFPVRQAIFTHLEDRISDSTYKREKIWIVVHPENAEVWYWLIPFSNGRCSLGVVGETAFFEQIGNDWQAVLHTLIAQEPRLSRLLANASFDTPVNTITGYSANVSSLVGNGYALLGNAGEFLDPVFSSGVTIAMKSASLAADVLNRQFQGHAVDWQRDYAMPLKKGVDTFRVYVTAWYNSTLQDVLFHPQQQPNIKAMICSILAGYVWDEANPYVKQSQARLNTLVELCRSPA